MALVVEDFTPLPMLRLLRRRGGRDGSLLTPKLLPSDSWLPVVAAAAAAIAISGVNVTLLTFDFLTPVGGTKPGCRGGFDFEGSAADSTLPWRRRPSRRSSVFACACHSVPKMSSARSRGVQIFKRSTGRSLCMATLEVKDNGKLREGLKEGAEDRECKALEKKVE